MASRKDYYDILGIRRDASEEEIEKAYQKLTRTYHLPSRNSSLESRWKEISEAYEILSNKEKRERYDREYLSYNFPWDFSWDYDPGEEEEAPGFLGFEDTVKQYLRHGEQIRFLSQRGKDLHCELEIEFEKAVRGGRAEVQVRREIHCSRCSGKGKNLTGPHQVCMECGGAGQIQIGLSPFTFTDVCPRCHGWGRVPVEPCADCAGKGWVPQVKQVALQIPPGVKDGCRIFLKGKGEAGKNGGPRGDLIVRFKVQKHPLFQRRGDDLHIEILLPFWDAALGAEVEMPTLDGRMRLRVSPGTQNGGQLRLPGKGVPHLEGEGKGDQVISFRVVVPLDLDPKSKAILEELKHLNPRPKQSQSRSAKASKTKT